MIRPVQRVSLPLPEHAERSGMIERLRILTTLNDHIGFDELTRHAYLDAEHLRERCEYASGVAVEVDHTKRTFRIAGHPAFSGQPTAVPAAIKDHKV
jgi:hypothetical protein